MKRFQKKILVFDLFCSCSSSSSSVEETGKAEKNIFHFFSFLCLLVEGISVQGSGTGRLSRTSWSTVGFWAWLMPLGVGGPNELGPMGFDVGWDWTITINVVMLTLSREGKIETKLQTRRRKEKKNYKYWFLNFKVIYSTKRITK